MRRANLVPRVLSSLSFRLASCMFSRFFEHKQSGTYSVGVGGGSDIPPLDFRNLGGENRVYVEKDETCRLTATFFKHRRAIHTIQHNLDVLLPYICTCITFSD